MSEKFFDKLKSIVGENNIIINKYDLEKYNKDWRGFYNKKSLCVVFPINIKIVKQIVEQCFIENIKIVPQAGNTSLTGASVPTFNHREIIINFSKMNKIIKLDKDNLTILVEPGLVLDKLKEYLDKHNLYFPIDLSSSGSCMIGGNIATNAGGINALKYGSMKDNINGMEIITGDGSVLTSLSKVKKNNTGYDLTSIISKSEGTLGLISKALLKIYPKPVGEFTFLASYDNLDTCIDSFKEIRNIYFDKLVGAELIPELSFNVCIKNKYLNKHFFAKKYSWYIIFRLNLYENKDIFINKFQDSYKKISNKIADIIIPQSLDQENKIWKFRDDLVEAYKMEGRVVTNDISIPLDKISNFFSTAQKNLKKRYSNIQFYPFGHLGDGNIHFNMILNKIKDDDLYLKIRDDIYFFINSLVEDYEGSFSAEHGIGQIKKNSLLKFKSKEEINMMKNIKKIFDPKNIMNPGKIFD